MISIREFRLPNKERRKQMTVQELIQTRDCFFTWISMHEESMTFADYDKQMDRMRDLEDYIETRL